LLPLFLLLAPSPHPPLPHRSALPNTYISSSDWRAEFADNLEDSESDDSYWQLSGASSDEDDTTDGTGTFSQQDAALSDYKTTADPLLYHSDSEFDESAPSKLFEFTAPLSEYASALTLLPPLYSAGLKHTAKPDSCLLSQLEQHRVQSINNMLGVDVAFAPLESVSESSLVWHVALMLYGVPSSAFTLENGIFSPADRICVADLSRSSLNACLSTFCAAASTKLAVERLVAICTDEQWGFGQCFQAFANSLYSHLFDIHSKLTEFEEYARTLSSTNQSQVTLLSLEAYLRPSLELLSFLKAVLEHLGVTHEFLWDISAAADYAMEQSTEDMKYRRDAAVALLPSSAELLSLLYDDALEQSQMQNRSSTIAVSLFLDSFEPYVLLLNHWLTSGKIVDPYQEFMIAEDSASGDERSPTGWNDRFRIQTHPGNDSIPLVPRFLLPIASNILLCGKSVRTIILIEQDANKNTFICSDKKSDSFAVHFFHTIANTLSASMRSNIVGSISAPQSATTLALQGEADAAPSFNDGCDSVSNYSSSSSDSDSSVSSPPLSPSSSAMCAASTKSHVCVPTSDHHHATAPTSTLLQKRFAGTSVADLAANVDRLLRMSGHQQHPSPSSSSSSSSSSTEHVDNRALAARKEYQKVSSELFNAEATGRVFIPFPLLMTDAMHTPISMRLGQVSSYLTYVMLTDSMLMKQISALNGVFFLMNVEVRDMVVEASTPQPFQTHGEPFNRLVMNMLGHAQSSWGIPPNHPYSGDHLKAAVGCLIQQYGKMTVAIDWPLNLVVKEQSINSYHRIYGFVLHICHTKQVLEELSALRKNSDPSQRAICIPMSFHLLMRQMYIFVSTLHDYVMTRVISEASREFEEQVMCAIRDGSSLDEVAAMHKEYLDGMLARLFLRREVSMLHKNLSVLLNYADQLKSVSHQLTKQKVQEIKSKFEARLGSIVSALSRYVSTHHNPHFEHLLLQLDFNNYYLEL
jgi:Gamma tubulin complex component C-terminal/Gamma tubulin complex component N-terminal